MAKLRKTTIFGAGVTALLLTGCLDIFTRELNHPANPHSPNYQGFLTVATVGELRSHTPDGASQEFQRLVVSEVIAA